MVVCICNAIREQDIRAAVSEGLVDVEDIYDSLGHAPNCRQCLCFAAEIVAQATRIAA